MTLQEARLAHGMALADMSQAEVNGDAEAHAEAKARYNAAAVAIIKAKTEAPEKESEDASKTALIKENAELKARIARLVNNLQKESDEKWAAMNKVDEKDFEIRRLRTKYEPNYDNPAPVSAAHTYGPKPQHTYPPLNVDEFMREWDDLPPAKTLDNR